MPAGEKRQFKDRDGDWRDVDDSEVTQTQFRTSMLTVSEDIAAFAGRLNRSNEVNEEARNLLSRQAYVALEEQISQLAQKTQIDGEAHEAKHNALLNAMHVYCAEICTEARRTGLSYRQTSMNIPAVNAGGSVSFGVWIPCEDSLITKIGIGFLTVPSSALGTILLNIYKKQRTRSDLTINGAVDVNGDVTVVAQALGEQQIQYAHVVGATGAGNEDRALAVAVVGKDITVTFGTDGAGASVVPTAAQVVALLAGDADASALVYGVAGGTGAGNVGAAGLAPLTGGLTDVLLLSSADFDLESLTDGMAQILVDSLADVGKRSVQPGEMVYATITSNNGDATAGVGGVVVVTHTINK
jgi:hypothetical protein